MDDNDPAPRMEASLQEMIVILHAHKMANIWAFDALMQTVEQVTKADIRRAVFAALETYRDAVALSSDEVGNFRHTVAEALGEWISHLKKQEPHALFDQAWRSGGKCPLSGGDASKTLLRPALGDPVASRTRLRLARRIR